MSSKPALTGTNHPLPFDKLSSRDFERLCLWLVEREGYERAEHLGAAGSEQGRDVIAWYENKLWAFQCKKVQTFHPRDVVTEVDKILALPDEQRPAGIVFVVTCDVSARARQSGRERCQQAGLSCDFWASTELDARIKRHPDLLAEFFQLPILFLDSRRSPASGFSPSVPFQAPAVPRHFVPRPEESGLLLDYLLADAPAGVLVVSAVHGLGGIGKTTLVTALTHLPEVQRRFPDGVLWVTLGQEAEVLSRLQEWIQSLGDHQSRLVTVDGASAHLCTLLHDKACLLVIDDAWQTDHVRPFLVGSERCRAVVTTRDAALARKVGAQLHDLDVLTEAQALALIEARLGRLDGRRGIAAALARELGYLPLAIELAAAQVEAGYGWEELLAAFRRGLAELAALDLDEPSQRNESLRLSFRLSLDRLSAGDLAAFEWLGVLPENAVLSPAMGAVLWGRPEEEIRRLLRRLRDRALLKGVDVDQYTVHDLLHDEAQLRLAEQMVLPGAHAALLNRYRAQTQDNLWHTVPDDGYVHEHLTWHMEQAGWEEEIHALLCEETPEGRNGWYEVRERVGQTAGYLADAARAWRLAEKEFTIGSELRAIGRQCRYALVSASFNSLARNIPVELIVALVEKCMWTASQGLVYARQIPDLQQRAEWLAGLVPLLPEPLRSDVLGEVLVLMRSIGDKWESSDALIELDRHQSKELMPQTLAAEGLLADVRGHVKALAAPRTDGPEWRCTEVLDGLTSHLSEELLTEALAAARNMGDGWQRSQALASIALHLREPLRSDVLAEALFTVRGIRDEDRRAQALVGLSPQLPDMLLGEALAAARTIRDERQRSGALAGLARHLPQGHLAEALAATCTIENAQERSRALVGLTPHLPEWLLAEALAAACTVRDKKSRSWVLAELAPHLSAMLLAEALAAARTIGDEEKRSWGLVGLARQLPEGFLAEALAAARTIGDEEKRSQVLIDLAPHLPDELLTEALSVACTIRDEERRWRALAGLAPHLPEGLLAEVLAAASSVRNEDSRSRVLVGLAPHLPEGLLAEALATACAISDKGKQSQAMLGLAPHLPEGLLAEALAAACAIRDEGKQSQVVLGLARHLPEGLLAEALAAARAIGNAQTRSWTLVRLTAYLPEPLHRDVLAEALTAARAVLDEERRCDALVTLTAYLPEPLHSDVLAEALTAARAVLDEKRRCDALVRLTAYLPEPLHSDVLAEALAAASIIRDGWQRATALVQLTPDLPERLLAEALAAARAIWDPLARSWALASLAPHPPKPMHREVLAQTLGAARTIGSEQWRTKALARIAPHSAEPLRSDTLMEALAEARTIGEERARSDTLAGLAVKLAVVPSSLLYSLWCESLHYLAGGTRPDLLADLRALQPVIAALGGSLALAETFRAIQDVGHWWP